MPAAPLQDDTSPSDGPHLLIVEDDQSVREMLAAILRSEGYLVDVHADAETANRASRLAFPDLAILDVGLPGMSGLELCERLRSDRYAGPVLMLTARHEIKDRVAGLDAGADDYLVKPFALDELLARVRAMLRRTTPPPSTPERLKLDDVELDTAGRVATRSGVALDLTKIEFDLLRLLMENESTVLTREVIHERIWGFDEAHMSNSLAVFVSQLRKKLEAGGGRRIVHTVRGVGYVARIS